ncbi:MAG: dTDP-glucose 4,6-dehydratase [Actinobacteria bacterium BACL4 MAG-120507-bin0]|jgi:dTDP-glucose 4,6-dehydratase|nr:MAG: dTDP-glucose 4,6-dehydratase [Actinobacteria bacterium BACL4 MAG-120507-bin0]
MRLLVTGGAGFIGSNYIRMLVNGELKGISKIIVLDKLTYSGNKQNLIDLDSSSYEFVQGDICDTDLVLKLSKQVDAIVNFAAESHVDRSIDSSREFIQTNVLGTHTLLESARKSNLSTFLQISTDEVYGSILEGSWDEDFPLQPNSPYAASKASADLISQAYHRTYGMDVRITRCSNNYGPYQYPEKVIPLFITNLIQDKKVPLYGQGLNVRDWLHVTDHCRGIHLVLTKGKPGDVFNIGGGRELSNLELTRVILEAMAASEERIEEVVDRLGHDFRYSLNIEKITNQLGYKPEVDFEEGISQTIEWYKSSKKWWGPLVAR